VDLTTEASYSEILDLVEELGLDPEDQRWKHFLMLSRKGSLAFADSSAVVPRVEETWDNAMRSIHDYAVIAASSLARTKGTLQAQQALSEIEKKKDPKTNDAVALAREYMKAYRALLAMTADCCGRQFIPLLWHGVPRS